MQLENNDENKAHVPFHRMANNEVPIQQISKLMSLLKMNSSQQFHPLLNNHVDDGLQSKVEQINKFQGE